jgi:hypothetical protein
LVRTMHKDRSPRTLGPSRAEDRNDRHDFFGNYGSPTARARLFEFSARRIRHRYISNPC